MFLYVGVLGVCAFSIVLFICSILINKSCPNVFRFAKDRNYLLYFIPFIFTTFYEEKVSISTVLIIIETR